MIEPAAAFLLLKGAVTLVWIVVLSLFAPGTLRFFCGRGTYLDPLRALLAFLIVKDLVFQSRGWIFGHRLAVMSETEIWFYIAALLCSLGGAHLMIRTVHGYETTDASRRR